MKLVSSSSLSFRPLLSSFSIKKSDVLAIGLLLGMFIGLTALAYYYLPVNVDWKPDGPLSIGVDWKGTYYLAFQAIMNGQSPYDHGVLQNPPWVLLPLLPLAFLPKEVGAAAMLVLTFYGYALAAIRMGYKPWAVGVLLLLPILWMNGMNGNIDFLIAIGMTLPPQIGLFFVLCKPQMAVGIAIFWLIQAWKAGGPRRIAYVFGPVTLAGIASLVVFGLWPLQVYSARMTDPYNASMWPLSAPLGAVLLYQAIRKNSFRLAILSSPFFSPYLIFHSYAIVFLGLGNVELLVAVVMYWFAAAYKGFVPFLN